MNANRIYSLLRYDWVINKHKLGLAATLISVIYCGLVLLYFYSRSAIDFSGQVAVPEGFPTVMAAFIHSYFSYALLAMVFVVTTILHTKFTNPRSATGYLSLPGTSLEKYIVMLADYAIATVAVFVLWIAFHYLTMAICWMVTPEMNWNVNPLQFLMPAASLDNFSMTMEGINWEEKMNEAAIQSGMPEFFNYFMDMLMTLVWFSAVINLVQFFAYICLNMVFRTNGQLKSIAIFFAGGLAFGIFCAITMAIVVAHDVSAAGALSQDAVPQAIVGDLMAVLTCLKYLCYFSPALLAGLAYLFYHQICRKQAK